MRCTERKEEQRETAVLESEERAVAASLSTQPSLVVSPVRLHWQSNGGWNVEGQQQRKGIHACASGGGGGIHLKQGNWYLPRQFLSMQVLVGDVSV